MFHQDIVLTFIQAKLETFWLKQITISEKVRYTCVFLQIPLVFQSPRPPVEVGLLWIEMLRFYSLEFIMADNVISVRTGVVLSREMKDWPKKRIAIEG